MNLAQWKMETIVGPLYLVASERGLREVFFGKKQAVPMAKSLQEKEPQVKVLALVVRQLEEYFKGKRQAFDLPFDTRGTAFQKQVWRELSKIPYGETCSYSDIARRIKNGKAVRAVGTANGRNPISIIVPCHRVIAADGTLGGYGGGLAIKMKLLALEKQSFS